MEDKVIRVKFSWVLVALVLLVLVSVAVNLGLGVIFPAKRIPVNSDTDQFVTTVNNVEISPSLATSELAKKSVGSIVLIANADNPRIPVGVGVVLTNDGLVVTTPVSTARGIVAQVRGGAPRALEVEGVDELYGLMFARIPDAVLVPLDVSGDDAPVGFDLKAVAWDAVTHSPRVASVLVSEYRLAALPDRLGVRRTLEAQGNLSGFLKGTPLLNDEAQVAGIVVDGGIVPASDIRASFERVANAKREENAWNEVGLEPIYTFATNARGVNVFAVRVGRLNPSGSAAKSGLKAQDEIISINETSLDWERNIEEQIPKMPFIVTAIRDKEEITVNIRGGLEE